MITQEGLQDVGGEEVSWLASTECVSAAVDGGNDLLRRMLGLLVVVCIYDARGRSYILPTYQ